MRPPPNSSQTAHGAAVGVIEGGEAEARSTAVNLFTQESFPHNFPLLPVVNYPYLTRRMGVMRKSAQKRDTIAVVNTSITSLWGPTPIKQSGPREGVVPSRWCPVSGAGVWRLSLSRWWPRRPRRSPDCSVTLRPQGRRASVSSAALALNGPDLAAISPALSLRVRAQN